MSINWLLFVSAQDNGQIAELERYFHWLLKSPGLGLLTSEPGLGKTAALRQITQPLNPHQYLVRYLSETDFGRVDLYQQLASSFSLELSHRRGALWRDIKNHITHLATEKNILPIIIIDESQNLSNDFLRDFPAILLLRSIEGFAGDSFFHAGFKRREMFL